MRGLFALISALAAANAAAVPITNPGFEEGAPGTMPTGWHSGVGATTDEPTAGYSAVVDSDRPHGGGASVRLESNQSGGSGFGTVTNAIDAVAYRRRRIRLSGNVRAVPAADGQVGMWLRVDRAEDQRGAFDNMGDRPINNAEWSDYAIEVDVAGDATKLVFGLLLVGHGKAWLDDVRIDDIGPARGTGIPLGWGSRPRSHAAPGDEPARPITPRGVLNLRAFARLYGLARFFHPSDEAAAANWDELALAGVTLAEHARTPEDLAAGLRTVFAPVAPSVQIYVTGKLPPSPIPRPADAVSAVRWHHVGYGNDPSHVYKSERVRAHGPDIYTVALPGGVSVGVPLAVWRDRSGATLPRASAAMAAAGKPIGFIPAGFDRTTRLGAVVAAWSMLGQFHPYFDAEDRAAWDLALEPALRTAATDPDDLAFRDTLRRLVARLHDGHATVPYYEPPARSLPLAWDWVQGRLVVTATAANSLSRGDVITAINGTPAAIAVAKLAALESGSPQWTHVRALDALRKGPPDTSAVLQTGSRRITLRYGQAGDSDGVTEPNLAPIAELKPGLFYVDIERVTQAGLDARIADLGKARGLVFDLRGYPRMSPAFLQHFSNRPVKSGHFISLAFDRPDRPGVPADDGQWTLEPLAPRFTANIAFITNGSAISYSESILGVVAGNHLADIVGEPSAGANGNITFFDLPGGYQISWTGMRVTNLNGRRHYLRGIQPNVVVHRTVAGVRAGRDELLDRALALVKARMRGN